MIDELGLNEDQQHEISGLIEALENGSAAIAR